MVMVNRCLKDAHTVFRFVSIQPRLKPVFIFLVLSLFFLTGCLSTVGQKKLVEAQKLEKEKKDSQSVYAYLKALDLLKKDLASASFYNKGSIEDGIATCEKKLAEHFYRMLKNLNDPSKKNHAAVFYWIDATKKIAEKVKDKKVKQKRREWQEKHDRGVSRLGKDLFNIMKKGKR